MKSLPSSAHIHVPHTEPQAHAVPLHQRTSIPIREYSAGGIVFRMSSDNRYEFVLIKDGYGKWTFPKGRIEQGESPEMAALAEVEEEAGIREPNVIGKLGEVVLTLHPKDAPAHRKKVFFFLIKTKYSRVEKEGKPSVLDARWFKTEEVPNVLGYANMKSMFLKATDMLKRIE